VANALGVALDPDAQVEYLSLMSNTTMTLATLTNDELELKANGFLIAGDHDAEEACLVEMLRRGHFPTEWLDELTEMAG
jgi:hypothetical protein